MTRGIDVKKKGAGDFALKKKNAVPFIPFKNFSYLRNSDLKANLYAKSMKRM